jgi:YkoY family integral membrane protein
MVPQTFSLSDIPSVLALIVLEGLLSADNALVLAVMVKHLPKDQRQRALLYGLGGAFVFRLIAILAAGIVLQQWWLQLIGCLYLLYLPIRHFLQHSDKSPTKVVKKSGFWQTVIAVEIADIAFAIDSVLAGVAFINNDQSKIWVVYLGAIIGLVLLRFAAGYFVRLLERFPMLDHMAYVLVGWVGVKLGFLALETLHRVNPAWMPVDVHLDKGIFWGVLLAIAGIGSYIAWRNQRPLDPEDEAAAQEMESAEDMQITQEEAAASERRSE